MMNDNWRIYRGENTHDGINHLPAPPPWRRFSASSIKVDTRGSSYQVSEKDLDLINAAIYLRRPLLVTGQPGIGKSTLAFSIAYELGLASVLRWQITTRTTLQDGLYTYDAIGRLQDANLQRISQESEGVSIGQYIRLGPLGTALTASERPRVLLIDEIDKSDVDLPNDLLGTLEEGEFIIPELLRMSTDAREITVFTWDGTQATLHDGRVRCNSFPIIIMTSNGERDFPPAFLRRCIRLDIAQPDAEQLAKIVQAHLGLEYYQAAEHLIQALISEFLNRQHQGMSVATDQLLNAIYLTLQDVNVQDRGQLREALLRSLNEV